MTVTMSDAADGGAFYSDSGCSSALGSNQTTISGADSATVYYKKTAVGTPTITAAESPDRSWTDASQNATVVDIITQLAFTASSLSADTDDCSALTIESSNSGGTATNISGGNKTVDLSDGAADGEIRPQLLILTKHRKNS